MLGKSISMKQTIESLLKKVIARTNCSLIFEYNDHNTTYQTKEDYYDDDIDWVDKKECFKINSFWRATWFKDSAVGSYDIVASTFEKLLLELVSIKERS